MNKKCTLARLKTNILEELCRYKLCTIFIYGYRMQIAYKYGTDVMEIDLLDDALAFGIECEEGFL